MNTDNIEKPIHFLGASKTINNTLFFPNENIWYINESVNRNLTIHYEKILIDKNELLGLKKVFKWYLENHSISHCSNMHRELKKLTKFLFKSTNKIIKTITDIDLVNYRDQLTTKHEWKLGALSGFLKKWHEMGFSCISKSAYGYLNETTIKGNIKGKAVSTMDPLSGPYSDLELDAIQVAINNAYAKGKLSTQDYILVWLFMVYGSRPIQFAQLKIKDIIAVSKDNNVPELIIKIPRAKNRKKARSEFKTRVVPPSLAPRLYTYCAQIKQSFKGMLDNLEEAPLFPNIHKEENQSKLAYHPKSYDITLKIKKIFNDLDLISERTGEKLRILPSRFRYTLGTRAASEGHGELIIAEILDHTDTQNAGVYVQSTPAIIERIDTAIAIQIAPLAQAFAGTLINDKSKAIRANDPDADIIDPNIDSTCRPTGKCGSYGFCSLMSPIACYTCSNFQAWTDGPHEALLMHLIKERERLLQLTDCRIASINDKTIFAVAQVVLACRQFNQDVEVLS